MRGKFTALGGILTGAPENAVFGPGTQIYGGLIGGLIRRPQERGLTARGPGIAAVARARAPLRVAGIRPALRRDENALSDTDSHG